LKNEKQRHGKSKIKFYNFQNKMKNKDMEKEAVEQELSRLFELTFRLEDELNMLEE